MNREEIDKLDKEHTAACSAYLDASDTLDDARKARHAASRACDDASYCCDPGGKDVLENAIKAFRVAVSAASAAYGVRLNACEDMLIAAKALNEAVKKEFLSEERRKTTPT